MSAPGAKLGCLGGATDCYPAYARLVERVSFWPRNRQLFRWNAGHLCVANVAALTVRSLSVNTKLARKPCRVHLIFGKPRAWPNTGKGAREAGEELAVCQLLVG